MKNNTKNLAVLMFVIFTFCIGITLVQAGMSGQECKRSIEAYISKYSPAMTKKALTKQDEVDSALAANDFVEFTKGLLDQGCADSPHFKENNMDLAAYNSMIANIKKDCLKLTGKEDCGSNQTSNNLTENNPKANKTTSTVNKTPPVKTTTALSTSDATALTSQCVQITDEGNYGRIRNNCSYKIEVKACGYKAKKGTTYDSGMNCEKQSFGAYSIGGNQAATAHTKNVEQLYWYACKSPASVVGAKFVAGEGIRASCKNY